MFNRTAQLIQVEQDVSKFQVRTGMARDPLQKGFILRHRLVGASKRRQRVCDAKQRISRIGLDRQRAAELVQSIVRAFREQERAAKGGSVAHVIGFQSQCFSVVSKRVVETV